MIFACLSFMFLVFILCGVSLYYFRVSVFHVLAFILCGVALREVRVPALHIFSILPALQFALLSTHAISICPNVPVGYP